MGIENNIQEGVGKVEEAVGKATGNEELRKEGVADRVEGGLGQIVDKAKEGLGDLASGVADKVEEIKDKFTNK